MATIQNHYYQSDGYSIDGFCYMQYDGYEADSEENVLQHKFSNMQIVPTNYYNNKVNVNNMETITIKFNNLNMDKS